MISLEKALRDAMIPAGTAREVSFICFNVLIFGWTRVLRGSRSRFMLLVYSVLYELYLIIK
jgi:hypothetical protein